MVTFSERFITLITVSMIWTRIRLHQLYAIAQDRLLATTGDNQDERLTQERREVVLLQAAAISTLVQGIQTRRLAKLGVIHQHYLHRLWLLRSGYSFNGTNLFVGIGRVEQSTEAIELATAFLCYELLWTELDHVVEGARSLRFADLPWPFERTLVSRVLGDAPRQMTVAEFPTTSNDVLGFLLNPQRAGFYGVSARELRITESMIWDPTYFHESVMGKFHEDDLGIVSTAHALVYSIIDGHDDARVQECREDFLGRREEWIAANAADV